MSSRLLTMIIVGIVIFLVGIVGSYVRKKPNKEADSERIKMPKFILYFGYVFTVFGVFILAIVGLLLFTDREISSAVIGLSLTALGLLFFGWMFRHFYQSFYIEFQDTYVQQRTAFLRHFKKIYYDDIINAYSYSSNGRNGHIYIRIIDKNKQKMDIDTTFFDVTVLQEHIKYI